MYAHMMTCAVSTCYNDFMNNYSNSRVFGAFLVGFAIVAGTYMINTFSRPVISATENVSNVIEAPLRSAITVKDSNNDGVEDWREEFVETAPIIATDDTYVVPDTLTEQVSLTFIQRVISSQNRGVLGVSQVEIVDDAVNALTSQEGDKIYDIRDIIITESTSDEAIRNYGNAVASAILENNVEGLRNELLIVQDIVNNPTPKEEDVAELKLRADVFKNTRDTTLNIAVPKIFVKEHLDLINVYNALYNDITSFVDINKDPLKSLLRLKRHDEDVTGMLLALENMYTALNSYSSLFSEDDPAVFFVVFSPNFNKP